MPWPLVLIKVSAIGHKTQFNKLASLPILTLSISFGSEYFYIEIIAIWVSCYLFVHVVDGVRKKFILPTRRHKIIINLGFVIASHRSLWSLHYQHIICWLWCQTHKFDPNPTISREPNSKFISRDVDSSWRRSIRHIASQLKRNGNAVQHLIAIQTEDKQNKEQEALVSKHCYLIEWYNIKFHKELGNGWNHLTFWIAVYFGEQPIRLDLNFYSCENFFDRNSRREMNLSIFYRHRMKSSPCRVLLNIKDCNDLYKGRTSSLTNPAIPRNF